jgi:hypothetical protein
MVREGLVEGLAERRRSCADGEYSQARPRTETRRP